MDKGLYILMSGAKETMLSQARVANNLANAKTTGFRADLANFRAMQAVGPGLDSRVFTQSERPGYNYNEGSLISTGNPLDVAIRGDGFIAVQRPDGTEAYTRAGDLQIDTNGFLITSSGRQVLGDGGAIVIPPVERLSITPDGNISIIPLGAPETALENLDRIKLVKPEYDQLRKGPDGLFEGINGQLFPADASVTLITETIEGSNVNAISELTDMIALSRQFEMKVKFMENLKQISEQTDSLMRLG